MSIQRPIRDQAHRATLADLEDLLVKGNAAVVATDLDGVITHWSAGAERLYGWSGDEAIGLPVLDLLVTLRDQALAEDAVDSTRRTGSWEGELDIRVQGREGRTRVHPQHADQGRRRASRRPARSLDGRLRVGLFLDAGSCPPVRGRHRRIWRPVTRKPRWSGAFGRRRWAVTTIVGG